ncbi:c6 zinc finger domain containing protein [Grosmannia clavigera kw1407]|uniref:C6 zinc finger domain containing protein n=1 Tax=Grosmannia clavigera (strain kw1407 / UAMH 11150) TaxID=655863 RepID=F0XMP9_GROCL|nr:c6 zinc finger domain containing protein [Grosmannia clavigera kw1407]EFX01037.1 c6 zinc finger domain containing protein [Grosmannia clavigera kw1407]
MAGGNSFANHTPPLAFTPDAESSPSNAPSQHEFVQIAPSTTSLTSLASLASSTTTHGPSLINSPSVLSQNGFSQSGIGQPLPQIPGATVYTPTAIPGIELNPRSCVTCRRRKVRCDKHMPCSNCRRALIPCIFPAPERAPRRPRRKDPSALRPHQSTEREIELLKRLRKLEGIVEELSGQVELEATKQHSSNGGSPEAINGTQGSIVGGMNGSSCADGSVNGNGIANGGHGLANGAGRGQQSPMMTNMPAVGSPGRLISDSNGKMKPGKDGERQFGRLVINDHGRSRYVSSAFWSKISDELDELRSEAQRISEPETEASETESSPPHDTDERPEADHHAFCFGFQSTTVDLRPLHPLPSQIPYIWQVYLENVDPVVKVLHTVSTSKLIRNARTNLDDISPAAEALMFAIYYAAVTSLDENEIKINFMADKEALVNKYRFALEQALAKAQFLVSADLVVLQAFVIYIVLIRRNDETRLAWTMTGLAIRISHSIGLHRDGSNFPSLSPFEVEMRRRLFWAICIIDMRSAEDLGTDLSILEHGFDTQLPLNINDSDISPESTTLPPPRKGATDVTFALIRYEILSVVRRMHVMQSGGIGSIYPVDATASLEERERMIHDIYEHIQEKYLGSSETASDPIFWVAGIIARVICTRMTLAVYQPILFPTGSNEDMSRELRDRLFTGSTELFEYTTSLTTDSRTKQWRWLFKTYMQWHAVAYILMEESRRPWSASVERSWQAISAIMAGPKSQEIEKMTANASIWLPFKMLYNKARKHREAEIQRLRADRSEVIRLDREDHVRLGPTIFSAAEGGIDGFHWREQWLELMGAPELAAESPAPPSTGEGSVADSVDAAKTEKKLAKALPEGNLYGTYANSDIPRQDTALSHFVANASFGGGMGNGTGGSNGSNVPTTSSSQQSTSTALVDGMGSVGKGKPTNDTRDDGMDEQRTWRPLPARHAQVPQLVVSATFGVASYAVHVSDLVHVWTEELSRRDICMRGFREDTPIDPSYDAEQMAVFLDKLRAALEPEHTEHGMTSLSLSLASADGSDGANLILHLSVELPGGLRPLCWPMCLARRQSASAVADELVRPLLHDRLVRAREATALSAALREKDVVIGRLADKLEALGAGLGSVFPALAGRHPQQQQQLMRAAMEERVPGLAPFSLDSLRRQLQKQEETTADRSLVEEALGDGDSLTCEIGEPSEPRLDGWWKTLGSGLGVSLQPTVRKETVLAEKPPPAEDAAAVADDDYVQRETPKKNRGAAAEPPSSPTPRAVSPSPPLPPRPTGKAGKLGRLGAIGKKRASTPPAPPPAEPEAAAAVPSPPLADSAKGVGEADGSDTASEAGDTAEPPAKKQAEEQQQQAALSATDVSVRPKSAGGRSLGRIGKGKKPAAVEAVAEAAAVRVATEDKKAEDAAKQKERLQQVVEKQAAPVRKKRKF